MSLELLDYMNTRPGDYSFSENQAETTCSVTRAADGEPVLRVVYSPGLMRNIVNYVRAFPGLDVRYQAALSRAGVIAAAAAREPGARTRDAVMAGAAYLVDHNPGDVRAKVGTLDLNRVVAKLGTVLLAEAGKHGLKLNVTMAP